LFNKRILKPFTSLIGQARHAVTKMDIPEADQAYLVEAAERINRYCHSTSSPGFNKLSEITQHLFITCLETSLDMAQLKAEGISAILYIGDKNKHKKALAAYAKKRIEHMYFELRDDPRSSIIPIFEPCYEFIHRFISDEKKVLIHCAAGVSRSSTILAYYLLKRYYVINFKTSPKKTKELINTETYFLSGIISLVKECRPCIRPNPGFVHQLLLTEYQLKKYFESIIRREYGEGHKKQAKSLTSDAESDSDESSDSDSDEKLKNIDIIIDESMQKKKILPKKSKAKNRIDKYDVLDDLRKIKQIL
jgi:atypical dual specificity phosphatase